MILSKRDLLFHGAIFRFHVKLQSVLYFLELEGINLLFHGMEDLFDFIEKGVRIHRRSDDMLVFGK